jgi:CheY-like chemotaxis protein
MLTSMGFEVTSAANGQEALDDMEGHDPDLILLDMKMPVMNGWEFCRALEGRDTRPPIVVLTAAPDPAGRAAEVHAEAGSASRSNTPTWRRSCAVRGGSCTSDSCNGRLFGLRRTRLVGPVDFWVLVAFGAPR